MIKYILYILSRTQQCIYCIKR